MELLAVEVRGVNDILVTDSEMPNALPDETGRNLTTDSTSSNEEYVCVG